MSSDPVQLALREITETKHLLEALTTSPDFFDYHLAKSVLENLRKKVRSLGKLQAELSARRSDLPELIIPFPPPGQPAN
jgi:hypothetical protein